jgi:NitT/TauT family transport system ATP-binding protein
VSAAAGVATLSQVGKTFRSAQGEHRILSNISMSIDRAETVAIMGANGVGKSTLAAIIAGVDESFEGKVERSSEAHHYAPMILQDFRASLLPWLSIEGNIGFPLALKGVPKLERTQRVRALLERAPARLDAATPIAKLSGGQAQLVCILRGFIDAPQLIVCDEPFSAIDYPARIMLRALIAETCRAQNIALLLVSHSIEDAVYLADRIIVLHGRPASIVEEIAMPPRRMRDPDWFDSNEGARFRRDIRFALDKNI